MLFKILHGDSSRISLDTTPFHEGWAYVTHDGYFYIDLNVGTEEQPNNQRLKLNAGNCETLAGMTWEEILEEIWDLIQNSIPTKTSELTNDSGFITGGEKEINSEAAYIKNVPESASSVAKVSKIGGLTRKCTNLFAYNTFVANGYTTRFNVTPGEVLYCAEGIDFPMQWGIYDVNGALIGTFYDFGFTNSSPLTVPSNASYVEVKAYGGQQGTYTQDGVCVGIPNGDSEHVLLINDECYGVLNKGSIVKIGAGYYTVIEDAPAGDAETEIRIYPALADSDINGEAYISTANEVQTAMQKYASLYIGHEPYFDGLRSAPVTEVESVGVNLIDGEAFAAQIVEKGQGTINTTNKTVTYVSSAVNGKTFFENFKPNTQYTFVFKGLGSAAQINLLVIYTDGTTGNIGRFSQANTIGTLLYVSDPSKSIECLQGNWADGNTTLYYNECGIFEGALTADDFKPYVRHTLPIPEAVRPKHGINEEVYDYIDLGAKQSTERVGVADMGMIDWHYNGYANDGTTTIMYSRLLSMQNLSPVLCSAFEQAERTQWENLTIGEIMSDHDNYIVVATNYTDAATFKAAMSGVMLYYELATPVVTDISDLLPSDNILPVEGGGTVTMVNEYGYDVPNEVTFYTNTSEHINASEFVGNLTGTATRAIADKYGNDIAETYITADALENIGAGDMLQATYDADYDGVVDKAEDSEKLGGVAASEYAKKTDIPAIPTIPTVNNGTLTIKQNGTEKGTFTANQSGNVTIELTDTNTHAVTSVAGKTGAVTLDKSDVRLDNVDNTADKDKYVAFAKNLDIIDMSNRDLNTITISGYYKGYTGMTNAPVQGIAVLEVIAYSPDWIIQRFTPITAGEGLTYERRRHSGNTWGEWKTNIDSNNIAHQSVNHATTADSANQVLINRSGSDTYFPIILTNSGDGTTTKVDSVYASTNNTVTMNPATGAVKAANFEGNATTATTAQALGGGGITATYNSSTDTVTFS